MKFCKMNKQTEYYLLIMYTEGFKMLSQCYKTPSDKKCEIYSKCVSQALEDEAYIFGIINYNTNVFTFGYLYKDKNKHRIFVVITPSKEYAVDVTEWEARKDKE